MLEMLKANILFQRLLRRPDIEKAYKMVPPTDSWYDTISTVHNSLAELQKLPHEILEITSHDGLKLKAVYYPNGSNKTMIWVHGYTSHAERESAFPGLFYRSLGFNLLIPYLRAHGNSEGKYISFGALENRDLEKWVEKVNSVTPDGRIVLHGLSMGGGTVLFISNREMKNVKCLVADAPNVSIPDFFCNVAKSVFRKSGDRVAECAMARFQKEFGVDDRDFDAFEIVKNSRYPIFLTAGSNENLDELLYSLQDVSPKDAQVLILPGCNHGNGMYKQTALYQGALEAFIKKYI